MKISMRVRVLSVLLLSIVTSILVYNNRSAWAEQVGSSPESGTTSRIKTIYDSLSSLSHGSDSAGVWGDWGVMWNRIRSAAEWVPSGDLDETTCPTGKTFYSASSRTQKVCSGPCVTNADCSVGTCNNFYQDSDGDLFGNINVTTKRCGTIYSGYVTDSTDADDSQSCPSGTNPTGTCNKCANGVIALQTSSEDLFFECTDPIACQTGGTNCSGSGTCTALAASPIGTSCGGGKVAYVNGIHGFVALGYAISGGATWGASAPCSNTVISGADGTAIGTGHQNTHDMAAAGCTDAAGLANSFAGDGYTDWFIPSKDELHQLYINRAALGGFSSNLVWSSSEQAASHGWAENLSTGSQNQYSKGNYYYLIPIRVF